VAYIAKNDLFRIPVPTVSDTFAEAIHGIVESSLNVRTEIVQRQNEAESRLLEALGLVDWTPPEPLTYTARATDAFAAKRLDGRFFAPRIRALLDILSKDRRTVADVAQPRREKFRPDNCLKFDYIEISDIDGAGAASSTRLACTDAPSRATWHVRPNDIITSAVRPIRRLSAQITPEQDGFVCSSGFVVVEPQAIASEVLLTYLRLPVICELLDLYASASMYPAITDLDIFTLPLPNIPAVVAAQVTQDVRGGMVAKTHAVQRLNKAKRAVEVAIEDGEPAAMAFLAQAEEAA
jgi:type I restriction enzyme S subunit